MTLQWVIQQNSFKFNSWSVGHFRVKTLSYLFENSHFVLKWCPCSLKLLFGRLGSLSWADEFPCLWSWTHFAKGLWAHYPNKKKINEKKIMLLLLLKWRSNRFTILHMSWLLCCHDMCKFVTWINHQNHNCNKQHLHNIYELIIKPLWNVCLIYLLYLTSMINGHSVPPCHFTTPWLCIAWGEIYWS